MNRSFPISFMLETSALAGGYLIGLYQLPTAITVDRVLVKAKAGQTTATVLEMEVGGVLSGRTVTLAADDLGEEASADVTAAWSVARNKSIRWKVVSGPDPVDAPSSLSLTMIVTEAT